MHTVDCLYPRNNDRRTLTVRIGVHDKSSRSGQSNAVASHCACRLLYANAVALAAAKRGVQGWKYRKHECD